MEVIKADLKNAKGTIAYEGNEKIANIYHLDNKMKNAPEEERLAYRKEKIQPLVDEFFDWVKE
ncbi:MAG: transposase, partial [Butyrivibrio sp.]|nr:transposase [Butyrivibrio sp.]